MGVRDELLPPLIEAATVVLREMAAVEAVPRDGADAPPADLAAVLRVRAETAGRLVLALPAATAEALARRVLGAAVGDPDAAMIRDCAGELANVIAGQLKTLLHGTRHHFTLATPTVVAGPEAGPATAGEDLLVVAFESDAGPFVLRFGFEA